MKYYYSVLNNYQVGCYPVECLNECVEHKERLDRYHTLVLWDFDKVGNRYKTLKQVIYKLQVLSVSRSDELTSFVDDMKFTYAERAKEKYSK